MPVPCPKTHYDVVHSLRPEFVAEIRRKTETCGERDTAIAGDEFDHPHIEATIVKAITRFAGEMLSQQGYDALRMSQKEIVSAIPPDVVDQLGKTLSMEYMHLLSFELFGRKTFHVRPNLVNRLADTEMNVESATLMLPFPSCMFVYDCQTAREALYAVAEGSTPPTNGPVSVYVNTYRVAGGERHLEVCAVHSSGKQVGALIKREIPLEEGQMLEESLRVDWTNRGQHQPAAEADDSVFYGPGMRLMRIVVNTALYLSSSDPDIRSGLRGQPDDEPLPPHLARKREKQLRHVTELEYVVVGHSVGEYDPGSGESGRQLDHRVKVRGHWKPQAYGKGRTLRKTIYIDPYWKGPDMAEIVSKPYVVR